MPVRIRFTGPATLDTTITISWPGGYPPGSGGTATATQTFKTLRAASYQTTIASDAEIGALNLYTALTLDNSVNFAVTRIGADVIINPLNGTLSVTATTTSSNIEINPTSGIDLLSTPQDLTPGYNPVTFSFISDYYAQPGFRYDANVYVWNEFGVETKIAAFKLVPLIDGSGYLDISKVLSNYLTVDAGLQEWNTNASNSYVKYKIGIGEEYLKPWQYSSYGPLGGITSLAGNLTLEQSPALDVHAYVVGDQINITSTDTFIVGLHTVMAVPDPYSVVLDIVSTATSTVPGIVNFADGSKTASGDSLEFTGVAFNGALGWGTLPYWDATKMMINSIDDHHYLCTSLKNNAQTVNDPDQWIYATPSQEFWFNYYSEDPDAVYSLEIYAEDESVTDTLIGSGSGNMKQFKIGFDYIYNELGFSANTFYFRLIDSIGDPVTRLYALYKDNRCTIEDYEILFMDRMGSLLSFAFQLRAYEKGMITRDMSKQSISYFETNSSYSNIYDRMTPNEIVTSVNLTKTLDLNTNWMNQGMSDLFEELLTSPYTWIRVNEKDPYTGDSTSRYYACTIDEKGFDVANQKNKRLIRKTITVKYANENIINI